MNHFARGTMHRSIPLVMTMLALPPSVRAQGAPLAATFDRCTLASGATIPNCRIAYRTFGKLNSQKSNVVLIATWAIGHSEDWLPFLGANALVDTTRFYTIIVDALADGHSSSPSNVPAEVRAAFQQLASTDMVDAQYRLVTEHLRLTHLHAVVGYSMGGMNALDWAVRHSSFVDRVVSIAGSPRTGGYGQLEARVLRGVIEDGRRAGASEDSIWARYAAAELMFVRTPASLDKGGPTRVMAEAERTGREYRQGWSLDDAEAHVRVLETHDITRRFGGDLARAAQAVTVPVLMIYSWDDHLVTTGPAAEFARLTHADTLSIASTCGHVMLFCETERVGLAVRSFLAR